jgi:hypothetical protein
MSVIYNVLVQYFLFVNLVVLNYAMLLNHDVEFYVFIYICV